MAPLDDGYSPAADSPAENDLEAAAKGCNLLLRLPPDLLRRLGAASTASRRTRVQWATDLITRALGKPVVATKVDRRNIAGLVGELRRIEAHTAASMRALADLEATARALRLRLDETAQFHAQVGRMANALDALFSGEDAYWRQLVEGDESLQRPGSSFTGRGAADENGPTTGGGRWR